MEANPGLFPEQQPAQYVVRCRCGCKFRVPEGKHRSTRLKCPECHATVRVGGSRAAGKRPREFFVAVERVLLAAFVLIAALSAWVALLATFGTTSSQDVGRLINAIIGATAYAVFVLSLVGLAIVVRD
jgi:hypothetical protein